MNRTETITLLRKNGLNVMPLKPRSKEPMFSWLKYQSEKYTDTIPEDANAGVICGKTSGNLVVIDIDTNKEELIDKILPDARKRTYVVKTCKGYHIYIHVLDLPKTLRLENHIAHVDVQSMGTYVVGPSSVHPSGIIYEPIGIDKILSIDFKIIQTNLEKLGLKPVQEKLSRNEIEKNGVSEGNRNNSMFKIACRNLQELKYDDETAWVHLLTVNDKLKPPLEIWELRTLFESAKKQIQKNPKRDSISKSKELYDLARSHIKKLVISQNNSNEVFALVEINNHVETLNLNSVRAKHWLNFISNREPNSCEIHGDDFYKNILSTISAHAQINNTQREPIYNRVAIKDGELFYDLVSSDWKAVKINKNNIDIISLDETTPIFCRTQSSYSQIFPKFDDEQALKKTSNLLRIVEEEKQLFEVHITSFLLEPYAVPIMEFGGEAGSLKTTSTTTVKKIIDPNGTKPEDNCTSMATRHDDLLIQLYNRYTSAFDNVTKIGQDVSDILCRAITGSGNPKRELYTNDSETILNFRRKIVLNGIVPTLDYPDLQERLISYRRRPLGENERLTEQEYQQFLDGLLPNILGKMFLTIQKAMNLYDNVKGEISPKSRLADFEIWGEAISRALGYEPYSFLRCYHDKLSRASISIKESYPIVTVIENLMQNRTKYENTATSCLNDLIHKANEIGIEHDSRFVRFPKAPNQITKELTIVSPVLRKLGIIVELWTYTRSDGKYTKHSSMITLTKMTSKNDRIDSPSSLHSPDSKDYAGVIGEESENSEGEAK